MKGKGPNSEHFSKAVPSQFPVVGEDRPESPGDSDIANQTQTPTSEQEDRHSFSVKIPSSNQSSVQVSSHTPFVTRPLRGRPLPDSCPDPSSCSHGTCRNSPHPGPPKGFGLHGDNAAVRDSRSVWSASEPTSPGSEYLSITSGEMFRVSSSGDVSISDVSIPLYYPNGHSRKLKLRPTFGYYPARCTTADEGFLDLNDGRSHHKLLAFSPEPESTASTQLGASEKIPIPLDIVHYSQQSSDMDSSSSLKASISSPMPGRFSLSTTSAKSLEDTVVLKALNNESLDAQASSSRLDFPISKVRHAFLETVSDGAPSYGMHEMKVRPTIGASSSFIKDDESMHSDTSLVQNTEASIVEELYIPRAKVRPHLAQPLHHEGSHQAYQHLPKAQAYIDDHPQSGFPPRQILSQCERCDLTTDQGLQHIGERNEAAHGTTAGVPILQASGRYAVSGKAEIHELDSCERLSEILSARRHSIQNCDNRQTYWGPEQRDVYQDDIYPLVMEAKTQHISQCVKSPAHNAPDSCSMEYCHGCSTETTQLHQLSNCVRYPRATQPDTRLVDRCRRCFPDGMIHPPRASQCFKSPTCTTSYCHSVNHFAGHIEPHQIPYCITYSAYPGSEQHTPKQCTNTHMHGGLHELAANSYAAYTSIPETEEESCWKTVQSSYPGPMSNSNGERPDMRSKEQTFEHESDSANSAQLTRNQQGASNTSSTTLTGRKWEPSAVGLHKVLSSAHEIPGHQDDNDLTIGTFQETPFVSEGLGSSSYTNFERTNTPGVQVIHNPVPVSKVRPHLATEVWPAHQNISNEQSRRESLQSEIYFDVRSDISLRSDRNRVQSLESSNDLPSNWRQSLASALDYRRTAQWLREIMKYPEPYTSRLTELPDREKNRVKISPKHVQPSDSVLSRLLPSQSPADTANQSSKSEVRVDDLVFKQAVNDLEKLLNEALAIASDVVQWRPETPERSSFKQSSISIHSHYSGIASNRDSVSSHNDDTTLRTAPETADGYGNQTSPEHEVQPKRPNYHHAETYSGAPERPRLTDIVQNYSSSGEHNRNRDTTAHIKKQDKPTKPTPQVTFNIPIREEVVREPKRPLAKSIATKVLQTATIGAQKLKRQTQYENLARGDASAAAASRVPESKARSHGGKSTQRGIKSQPARHKGHGSHDSGDEDLPSHDTTGRQTHTEHGISLRRRSHVSLRGAQGFSLAKSHKRQPIARDWSPIRKRFVASVACISTALIGMILGIYAGLVPSIQYYIIDQSHATVHGNTGCFVGLAIPTFFLWPLPLLHGRKPYVLSSLVLAMPLLFPQALAVNSQRLTHTVSWRALLLAARTLMGCCLGFASMNFHSILTDLFGASLMSSNPHQEVVDNHDARRHGGGMGVWLGIWTWCWIGSLGVGFLTGACLIENYPPAWGFYVSIMLLALVLFLNVVSPEVRRSAFRRSVTEVRTGSDISRRVARGEIMMHRVKTGPKWWGQEVYHGVLLSLEMLRQPGFAVLAVYSGWIYAQVVLIIILLGSLSSRFYHFRSPNVGLLVGGIAMGAMLAIPFQKAGLFSRSRQAQLNTNKATMERRVSWSSHLVRRTIFSILLPLAGICYAAVSTGPPLHISLPTIFATCVGFLSCLAIAECNGIVMECFDCSDLSPGMTGSRQRESDKTPKRTNYSSFPRVTAGFAVIHSLAFIFAAGSTALGGHVTRTLGQRVATGVVAGVLLILTLLLLLVLARFAEIQIIPKCKSEEMDKLIDARRRSTIRRASMPDNPQAVMEEEKAWRPAMMGNPIGKKRRMNILELGGKTRWQAIRMKNKLIDAGAHLNRAAWDQGMDALDDQMHDLRKDAQEFFHHHGSNTKKRGTRRLDRSDGGSDSGQDVELELFGADAQRATSSQPGRYVERECVMGQTVTEESDLEVDDTWRRR